MLTCEEHQEREARIKSIAEKQHKQQVWFYALDSIYGVLLAVSCYLLINAASERGGYAVLVFFGLTTVFLSIIMVFAVFRMNSLIKQAPHLLASYKMVTIHVFIFVASATIWIVKRAIDQWAANVCVPYNADCDAGENNEENFVACWGTVPTQWRVYSCFEFSNAILNTFMLYILMHLSHTKVTERDPMTG